MESKKKELKIVDIRKIRFAPEIEVEFNKNVDADKIIAHEKIRKWDVKYDGSLTNGAEFTPIDSNKLYWNRESLRQIQDVLRRIKTHRGVVSGRCGLHIHLDMTPFSDEEVVKIVQEFIHKQRWIVNKFHVKLDRLDNTCKLLPRKYLTKITARNIHTLRKQGDWYSQYNYFDRYSALNILCLSINGSIEIRLFNASTSYEQLTSCIRWCLLFIKDCIERD